MYSVPTALHAGAPAGLCRTLIILSGGNSAEPDARCSHAPARKLTISVAYRAYHTRKTGVIVTAEAYHGNSGAVAGNLAVARPRSRLWIPMSARSPRPIPTAYPFRGNRRRMAEDVARQIADMERAWAALGGLHRAPSSRPMVSMSIRRTYLARVAEVVRKAGGLFIADEGAVRDSGGPAPIFGVTSRTRSIRTS